MSKRRIILFASVLSAALIVIIVVFLVRRGNNTLANPFKIIPADAALIVQVNSFHNLEEKLFSQSEVYKSFSAIESFDKLKREMATIDSIATGVTELGEIIYNSQLYISAHIKADAGISYLYIIHLNKANNLKNALKALGENLSQDIKSTENKYEGKSVYQFLVRQNEAKNRYYLAEIEGNILLSRSQNLIEASVRQFSEEESLLTNQAFNKLAATSGKMKDANLYINLKKSPGVLAELANDSYAEKFRDYSVLGSWMVLDLNAAPDRILFNGFVSSDPSGDDLVDIFKDNEPVKIGADSLLPASTTAFLSLGAENLGLLNEQYRNYREALGNKGSQIERLKNIENSYGVDFAEVLLPLMEEEITLAQGEYIEGDNKPASLILIKCKSGEHAFQGLQDIASKIQRQIGGTPDQLRSKLFIAPESYPVVKIPVSDLSGLLFGDLFSIKGIPHFTVWRNYIAWAGSREVLESFLYHKARKKTLSTNEAFSQFKSKISDRSFLLFYGRLTKSAEVFKEYLHEDVTDVWNEHTDEFQKIQPFGFQITKVGGMNYANFLINYTGTVEGKPTTVWESQLQTSFSFKPQFVQNHYTKENEIFLQDEQNNIYLINNDGIVLWKQNIPEAINSSVVQIDYFGNGKLQYLFSTATKIYLIDRDGNRVEPYPISLRSPATAGMSLFDYEGDRNYRIFIPCRNNQVYAYSKEGKIISGWEFQGSDNRINQSPEHFRINNKDYIVVSDKYRTYILNRRGEERVKISGLVHRSANNTYHLNKTAKTEFSTMVTTDTSGQVIHVSFSGEVKEVNLGSFSAAHYFDFKDVDADGEPDYIFLDQNTLKVFRQDKTKIFEYNFPNTIQQKPIYFEFSRHNRKLGIVDTEARRIYLINSDGTAYKGFPLEGSTLFSIGFLENQGSHFNLIVGGRNNFLYNYSVQ